MKSYKKKEGYDRNREKDMQVWYAYTDYWGRRFGIDACGDQCMFDKSIFMSNVENIRQVDGLIVFERWGKTTAMGVDIIGGNPLHQLHYAGNGDTEKCAIRRAWKNYRILCDMTKQ